MALKIALDWTPNTNHTGFFVAQELGYYAAHGVALEILHPGQDNYATTPAKKVELSQADFAIAPFESVISLNTKAASVQAVAIAALLQQDISSIATLTSSGITRPRELDSRTYASYQARYEDAIVRQLIRNDGGQGTINITYPEKLGIWDTLLTKAADATWIFNNWEGIEAETQHLELTKFALADYAIPYAYSPVIFSTRENISANAAAYRAFLAATKQGFQFAVANPAQAAAILLNHLPARDAQAIDVVKSQHYVAPFYGDAATWGTMEPGRITVFLEWLIAHELESEAILSHDLFTNELLS
jgi:ABC-type nitrate/sulfonate/bicarbonate transport system substrate-binding protein